MIRLYCGCKVSDPTDTELHWCPCDASWYIRDGDKVAYGVEEETYS